MGLSFGRLEMFARDLVKASTMNHHVCVGSALWHGTFFNQKLWREHTLLPSDGWLRGALKVVVYETPINLELSRSDSLSGYFGFSSPTLQKHRIFHLPYLSLSPHLVLSYTQVALAFRYPLMRFLLLTNTIMVITIWFVWYSYTAYWKGWWRTMSSSLSDCDALFFFLFLSVSSCLFQTSQSATTTLR